MRVRSLLFTVLLFAVSEAPLMADTYPDLNTGPPYTVRLIYFLPKDRPFREEIVQKIEDVALRMQSFYSEQMEAHGYGENTFALELDEEGEPLVHVFNGAYADSHYVKSTTVAISQEIFKTFSRDLTIYVAVIDNEGTQIVGGSSNAQVDADFRYDYRSTGSGLNVLPEDFNYETAVRGLAHGFGSHWYDFRREEYLLSYSTSSSDSQLSPCHAEFLSVHPYFDSAAPDTGLPRAPRIELLSPTDFRSFTDTVPVRVRVAAATPGAGIHQVFLLDYLSSRSRRRDVYFLFELGECLTFDGEEEVIIEFDYNVDFRRYSNQTYLMKVVAVDTRGSVTDLLSWFRRVSPEYLSTLKGGSDHLALSSDGRILVAASGHSIALFDISRQEELLDITGHYRYVRAVAISPDMKTVVSGYQDGKIELWNLTKALESKRRELVAAFEGHEDWITSLTFSPDSQLLVSGSRDATIRLWNLSDLTSSILLGHRGYVYCVDVSPDGSLLASGSGDGTVKLWNLSTQEDVLTIDSGSDFVTSVAFTPNGQMLVIGASGVIKFWNLEKSEVEFEFNQPGGILALAFSPDGGVLASSSWRGSIQLWDLNTGTKLGAPLTEDHQAIRSVVFSSDGTLLISGSSRGIQLWDALTATRPEVGPDFNGDGVVNFADFSLFAESFGSTDVRFDLDGSGIVDFADFFILAESFGRQERAKLMALAQERLGLPENLGLQQNWPNPFNGQTVISWFQAKAGPAQLEIYALTGQRIAVLSQDFRTAGMHRIQWDGLNHQGRPLASGVYIYRLATPEETYARKMTLVR